MKTQNKVASKAWLISQGWQWKQCEYLGEFTTDTAWANAGICKTQNASPGLQLFIMVDQNWVSC